MNKTTSLPWQTLPPHHHEINTLFAPPYTIAMVANPDDAKFIVRAVNAHDDLLEACKFLLDIIDTEPEACGIYKSHADMARAAIAKATGK